MDTLETVPETVHRPSSLGTLIGILLILGVVVAGAYFELSSRIASTAAPQRAASSND